MSKKFELYEVTAGPIKIAPSTQLMLTAEQIAPRQHQISVIEKAAAGSDRALIAANGPLDFKKGEVIGLAGCPDFLSASVTSLSQDKSKPADKTGPAQTGRPQR